MWSQMKKSHLNVIPNEQVSNQSVSIVCTPPKTVKI